MAIRKKNKNVDFKIEIGLPDNKSWSDSKLASVKEFIKSEAAKRSEAQVLKNQLLSIQYQMEEYIDNGSMDNEFRTIETFLKDYLEALNLTFKRFAIYVDTTDGNLKKYVSGVRKFNTDLALKFGHFFHTSPDLWLNVQIKNELASLKKEKKQFDKYRKYDYEKVLSNS
jgi:antitoxin HigA-1